MCRVYSERRLSQKNPKLFSFVFRKKFSKILHVFAKMNFAGKNMRHFAKKLQTFDFAGKPIHAALLTRDLVVEGRWGRIRFTLRTSLGGDIRQGVGFIVQSWIRQL